MSSEGMLIYIASDEAFKALHPSLFLDIRARCPGRGE